MARVLVIGSGGREQALAWKLAQSTEVDKVFIAPGNGGSRGKIKNVNINFTDSGALLNFAKSEKIDLSVVGQEIVSVAGVVDEFTKEGLTIFGPTKAAAKIESSKVFSKNLMKDQNIPTAEFKVFNDPGLAKDYAVSRRFPIVIKADGLAGGKGVIIASNEADVELAIKQIMVDKIFGESGNQVVIEDFLKGAEVSIHALCDGDETVLFPPAQDHKQVYDNDKGPNTGGMGVYAPLDFISQDVLARVKDSVVLPALSGLKQKNAQFRGCLYPGLMIDGADIALLEFNARFGDPEIEVFVRLLDSDLYKLLRDCALGKLDPGSVKWKKGYAISVALASAGYPGDYSKGEVITGIDQAEALPDIVVFHAGTKLNGTEIVTNGGRVLIVSATGLSLSDAIAKVYEAVEKIHFEGMHYRRDIGSRAQN